MKKTNDPLARIARALRGNDTFFIAGHLKPDGDTIGTGVALASLLRRLGKKVTVYSREAIPANLRFIPGAGRIVIARKISRRFDCAIILECKDFARMGDIIDPAQVSQVINIDHHAAFSTFGDINYIDPTASSSAEQVFRLFSHMRVPILCPEAIGLYVGLVTDTGMFQHSNTTPSAVRMGASLLETGIVPAKIYDHLYASNTLSSLHLLGNALQTMAVTSDGRIVTMSITRQAYRQTGADSTETEGVVNFAMRMPGTLVGVLFREADTPGQIKVSLRSRGSFNVNAVAHHFGGGGHKHAAGCTLKGPLSAARALMISHLQKLL